ncbi:unnamed protein product [Closterium sp. NIES-64]|nr:unnamed protein product [Closterium sp. NIES-64]
MSTLVLTKVRALSGRQVATHSKTCSSIAGGPLRANSGVSISSTGRRGARGRLGGSGAGRLGCTAARLVGGRAARLQCGSAPLLLGGPGVLLQGGAAVGGSGVLRQGGTAVGGSGGAAGAESGGAAK